MISARFRFILASIFFLISLRVMLPATSVFLWHLTLLATEFGHWLGVVLGVIILAEIKAKSRFLKGFILGISVLAALFFFIPVYQAAMIARTLPEEIRAAFGSSGGSLLEPAAPLQASMLWQLSSPVGVKEIALQNDSASAPAGAIELYSDGRQQAEPCLLMVHGGGWNSGDEKQLSSFSRMLAASGCRVASVAYRLAPEFPWPAQREDVLSAFTYLKRHARELSIDPSQFVFFGRSAGGQIALASAYAAHDPAIRGCISLYAPTDMFFAYVTGGENDILHSRVLLRDFLGGPPNKQRTLYASASPLLLADASSPPTLLVHGTRDEIVWVRHAYRLRQRLLQLGRPVYLLELPWATHAFEFNPDGPGAQLTVYAILRFMNAVTSSPSFSRPPGR